MTGVQTCALPISYLEDDTDYVGVVLCNAYRGEQVSVDLDVFVGDFRSEVRGMQIEKNALWPGEAAGGVLHDIFEVNGDAGGVRR